MGGNINCYHKYSSGRRSLTDFFLFSLVCFLVIYLSYRYPFQINSSTTSPTYSDTPLFLQLGKYFIAIIGCLFALLFKAAIFKGVSLKWFLLLFAYSFFHVIKFSLSQNVEFLESVFWPIISLCMVALLDSIDHVRVYKFIKWLFAYSLIFQIVQIFLFFGYGRLPALAYEDSFSVRFGSFLDDPNGFAVLCFLFIGFFYSNNNKFVRIAGCLLSAIMIFGTQSLTLIFVFFVLFFWVFVRSFYRGNIVSLITLLFFSFGIAYFSWSFWEVFLVLLEGKQGSIANHSPAEIINDLSNDVAALFFGFWNYVFTESWPIQLVANYGLIAFVIYFGFMVFVVAYCYLHRKKIQGDRCVYNSLLCFMFAFVVASLNLPTPMMFPINFIFFLGSFLLLSGKLSPRETLH